MPLGLLGGPEGFEANQLTYLDSKDPDWMGA
jgi:hypothetical protein